MLGEEYSLLIKSEAESNTVAYFHRIVDREFGAVIILIIKLASNYY